MQTTLCLVDGKRRIDDLTPADYSNFVRASRKRYISDKYTAGRNTLPVYLLDQELERKIRESREQSPDGSAAYFVEAVRNEIRNDLSSAADRPVLLTHIDIRGTVRRLIKSDFPNLAVVGYQELSPDMNILPKGRISCEFPLPVTIRNHRASAQT